MTVQDIEASRAAVAAEITKVNEAEAALVAEVDRLAELASALSSTLMAVRHHIKCANTDGWQHANYWTHRKEINPTLEHFGFVVAEHAELRGVGVVVRKEVAA